ncbi:MAG: hypothetical protein OEW04_09700 [Nitrospirota bacterium]|nr:hypothetical protein [Nitrospirota bacterium]
MKNNLSECGIAYDSPMDIVKAQLSDDGLLLVTNKSVRSGTRSYGKIGKGQIYMTCDINAGLKEIKDLTADVNKGRYGDYSNISHPLSGELTQYLRANDEHKYFYAKWVKCSIIEAGDDSSRQHTLPTVNNNTLKSLINENIFFYSDGPANYYPLRNYLIVKKNDNIYIIPVFYADTQRRETALRFFKYPLYPVMIALDIITFPIQILTMESAGHGTGGFYPICPDWTKLF